jgi:hypothetical protein
MFARRLPPVSHDLAIATSSSFLTWDETHQVFGESSGYAWPLEDDNDYDEEIQQQKLDMKYTDVRISLIMFM